MRQQGYFESGSVPAATRLEPETHAQMLRVARAAKMTPSLLMRQAIEKEVHRLEKLAERKAARAGSKS